MLNLLHISFACHCVVHLNIGKQTKKPGGQTRLTEETEKYIVELLDTLSAWKIPLVQCDLCHLVKDYLDNKGIVDAVSNIIIFRLKIHYWYVHGIHGITNICFYFAAGV